ncbi:hypothetical protein N0V93_003940 [Gnomoniopsis smithogilvyi]|uniref:C2H2-type domain-containing protein n=1 Tax=Gnomoniopsis smithogilvyi TaxID=1191159 RepID=A0A9W9CZL6_9PEZI|nr:hypothetical protein N0V93_003940 [Gnomoniopsis smithogilvyi]
MNTMSSSTFNNQPSLLDSDRSRDRQWPVPDNGANEHVSLSKNCFTVTTSHNLSPYSHIASSSTSPINNISTPADSVSALSEQYPPSDFSDNRDPFFGVDFDDIDGSTPGFLEDSAVSGEDSSDHSEPYAQTASSAPQQNARDTFTYPIKPNPPTSSIQTTFPRGESKSSRALGQTSIENLSLKSSIPFRSVPSEPIMSPLISDSRSRTDTTLSSEEGMSTTTAPMPSPSPRVTVSMWGRDQAPVETSFPELGQSPATLRPAGISADDTLIPATYHRGSADRNKQGTWTASSTVGPNGWGPESRPADQVASINEVNGLRGIAERNLEVDRWVTSSEGAVDPDAPPTPLDPLVVEDDGIPSREIPLGSETENVPVSGQTYYTESNGLLTEDDFKLMKQHRLWSDAPAVYRIDNTERTQPETAQAAMRRFEQMCQETGSVLSRSATWGTRRRSLPSIADIEGVTGGSFLRKLTISRDRKPSFTFKDFRRGLLRKPSASQLLKRHRTVPGDDDVVDSEPQSRRETHNTLAPPSRSSSWAKKQQMPSLNTALVSMATGAAAIGTTHARSGSISNVTSPKSPFFKNVRRARSRSELPKAATSHEESQSALAGMWKKAGGPPVAQLARGNSAPDPDDEEDDDDLYEEGDAGHAGAGATNIIDDLAPTLAGFREQVLRMNPRLAEHNTYLVDRIAHQQVVRYKELLNKKVKHIGQTSTGTCPSGPMCHAYRSSNTPFDARSESYVKDPSATAYEGGSEGDGMPVEGSISPESFPMDIPMPPVASLPAEFECQLCFSTKKFIKPSDWTKHVHEDVQPFTCTWDRCREPKIFKRKADWVRHENEGHRHLEWWTCDVEDCKHTCFRRDNFLQHLVREHKFPEPKVKTKAALKRAGAQDITWQKVEKCHADTTNKPQGEPCRFCGKVLPTWKKLTVHLAKHMETMSLPILRLVARQELDADTIISPVQDPPPRTFPPPVKSEAQSFNLGTSPTRPLPSGGLTYPATAQTSYTHYPSSGFPNFYDSTNIHGLQQPGALNLGIPQPEVPSSFPSQTIYSNLAGSSSGNYLGSTQYNTMPQQMEPFPAYNNPLGLQDASGHQLYDATALNPTSFGGDQQQYSQGSPSPYSRSPHQSQGGYFQGQR